MFTLVIGGSASGKSEYAERFVLSLDGSGPRIYIATMEPFGSEAQARIARHHAMRRGRGFETLECYQNIGSISVPLNSNVLLEDLGNLVANELFGGCAITEESENALPERIAEEIRNHIGTITKAELVEQVPDVSQTTVQRTLTELTKQGKILKLGAGPYIKYRWNWDQEDEHQ